MPDRSPAPRSPPRSTTTRQCTRAVPDRSPARPGARRARVRREAAARAEPKLGAGRRIRAAGRSPMSGKSSGSPKHSARGPSPKRAHRSYLPAGRNPPARSSGVRRDLRRRDRRRKPRGTGHGPGREAHCARETVCKAAPSSPVTRPPEGVREPLRARPTSRTASLRRSHPAQGGSEPPQRCRSRPRLVIRRTDDEHSRREPAARIRRSEDRRMWAAPQ